MRRLILPTTSHSGPLKYGSLVSGLKCVRLDFQNKVNILGKTNGSPHADTLSSVRLHDHRHAVKIQLNLCGV